MYFTSGMMCCILEPPTWTVNTLSTLNVLVNETIELRVNCIGRGNPAPVIYWTKDGQTLDTAWYTVYHQHQPVDTYSTVVHSTLSWQGTVLVVINMQLLTILFQKSSYVVH